MPDAPILDLYAPLNHKAPMGPGPGAKFKPPSWVRPEDIRRLTAYEILDAYCKNNARTYRPTEEQADLREYGDADALVEAILAALIGDSQVVSVDNAEAYDPDFKPDENTTERQLERQAAAEVAADRQLLLDQWADDEELLIKIPQAERKAVKLGDASVYVLDWSPGKERPRLRTYDPGFYYPKFDDWSDDFPRKAHFAWEIEDAKNSNIRKIRRITYELKEIEPDPDSPTGWPEGVVFSEAAGMASMLLPWNEPDKPATMLCYKSDGIWTVDVAKQTVDDFSDDRATWNETEDGIPIRNLPLNIDFLPVVHVPNTEEDEEHFGASSLLRVAQLLDDLQSDDTDLGRAAATSGFPVIGMEGGDGAVGTDEPDVKWGPGATINNPNGRITLLSTATALEPLSNLNDRLLERLSVNARVPASALGRIKQSGNESGIHLLLSYGPMKSMIGQMRLGRRSKYRLLTKFVQRFFQLDGQIPAGPENILNAEIVFGSFLPSDRAAAITEVRELHAAKLVSRRTALSMLAELGLPIDDADEELERIEREDFEGAMTLADATGDTNAARERLGLDPVVVGTAPPPAPEF